MPTIFVDDPRDPRLDDFRNLAGTDRLARRGLFIVEGRLVVERLLTASPLEPIAIVVTDTASRALAPSLARWPELPVYVVPLPLMQPLTGFNIHRGCLATARRPAWTSIEQLLESGHRRWLVLEGVTNPDNVGGLMRTARAFRVDATALAPGCGDPLYRKAVRVSCGAALVLPFALANPWPDALATFRRHGVPLVALAPQGDETIDQVSDRRQPGEPVAIMVGAESSGLSAAALAHADHRARIDIDPQSDSLNVTVAAGIALHWLR